MEIGKRSTVQTPAPRPSEARPTPTVTTPAGTPAPQGSRKGWKAWVIVIVVLAVVLAGGFFAWKSMNKTGLVGIDTNKYQAVFLTNGQVYFGKLSDSSNYQVKISDIYYLQVQQNVQPAEETNKDSQVSLAKLGQELHGPEDSMYISKDQVLFWENLKDDGKVVQAIKSNK